MRTLKRIAQMGILAVVFSALCSSAVAQPSEAADKASLTGAELWEKVIAHHDPKGIWTSFSGKVHLVTTFSDGTFGQEELEIRRPEDFYRATRISGNTRATRGVRKGECFRDIDGTTNPEEARVKEFNIGCDSALRSKEHHTGHFGLPMALKTSGMEVDKELRSVDFQGRKALVLAFTGRPGAVKHSYYTGRWMLYVDPATHALRGVHVEGPEFNAYCATAGELNVGGVVMPQVKTCYRAADDTFWFVDTFSYAAATREK